MAEKESEEAMNFWFIRLTSDEAVDRIPPSLFGETQVSALVESLPG